MILGALLILSSISLALTAWLIWYVRGWMRRRALVLKTLTELMAARHEELRDVVRHLEDKIHVQFHTMANRLREDVELALDAREAARKAEEQQRQEQYPTGSFLPVGDTEAQREAQIRRTSRNWSLSQRDRSAAPSSSSGRPSSRAASSSAAKPSGATP